MSEAEKRELGADTGGIIVINHRSHLDGFALMDVVPDEKWFTFAAKKELCDAALLRTGFTGAGLVEIDRKSGKAALETLMAAVKGMPARRSVVLFPEGTRAATESLGDFKPGAVLVAREIGPTFVQLYTPCILEIGKQSMEGLDEMKDSESIGGRFVQKEYITDEAQKLLDSIKEETKTRKKAAKAAKAAAK